MIAFDFMCWTIGILISIIIVVILVGLVVSLKNWYKDYKEQKALKEELNNPRLSKTRRKEFISP